MRNDVHMAALRAAAKVAFSVAVVGGCSSSSAETTPADLRPAGDAPFSKSDRYGGASGSPSAPAAAAPDATSVVVDAALADASAPDAAADVAVVDACTDAPVDCAARLDATFPSPGDYPGTKTAIASEAAACCVAALTAPDTFAFPHRWDCCASLPAPQPREVVMACTPWGPPVPPAMTSRGTAALDPEVVA